MGNEAVSAELPQQFIQLLNLGLRSSQQVNIVSKLQGFFCQAAGKKQRIIKIAPFEWIETDFRCAHQAQAFCLLR